MILKYEINISLACDLVNQGETMSIRSTIAQGALSAIKTIGSIENVEDGEGEIRLLLKSSSIFVTYLVKVETAICFHGL